MNAILRFISAAAWSVGGLLFVLFLAVLAIRLARGTGALAGAANFVAANTGLAA